MKNFFNILGGISIVTLSTLSFTFAYTQEQETAYNWAYYHKITTQPTIEEAKMNSPLTRQAFAKMIVNYLENVMKIELSTPNSCIFLDESKITNDLLPYAKKVCAYGIMGSDGKNFNPTEIVDRAQLGTVFSRVLWGDRYNVAGKGYYIYHVNALKDVGIMNNIDNVLGEPAKRGDVMIMFQRMLNKFGYTSLTSDKNNITKFLRKYVYLEGEPIMDSDSGIWESYYENGQLEAKGIYKNGSLYGEFLHYYRDGQLHIKCNFKNGSRDGEYITYYENGQIMEEGKYINGEKDGERINYYNNGQINLKHNYKNGKINGISTNYYDNGQIESSMTYKNGEEDGERIHYYKNGQIQSIGIYKDGMLNGEHTTYYENGKISSHGLSKEGEPYGERIYYYENGQIREKSNFKNDKSGVETLYYNDNGQITSICDCDYRKRNCKCTDYNDNGNLPDSAEIIVEKNIVAGEATNLKITMMKDGAVMTGYTGTIIMMVTEGNGSILSHNEYTIPYHGVYTFLPGDFGSKEFPKGLEIKKEGNFYIEVSDLNDPEDRTLGKQLVTLKYSGDTNNNSITPKYPKVSNLKTKIDKDNNTVYLTWDVDDDSLSIRYLITYWIDGGFLGNNWAETKDFLFTDVPYDTTVNVTVTPYGNNGIGVASEIIQFTINS